MKKTLFILMVTLLSLQSVYAQQALEDSKTTDNWYFGLNGGVSSKITHNNDFFGNQEIKQDLQSFYNAEAKKYAETRKKFWHEEKAILDAITPLFNDVISNECEKSTGQMECNTHIDPHASFHSAQDDKNTQDSQLAGQASAEFTPLSGVSE